MTANGRPLQQWEISIGRPISIDMVDCTLMVTFLCLSMSVSIPRQQRRAHWAREGTPGCGKFETCAIGGSHPRVLCVGTCPRLHKYHMFDPY